MEKTNNIILILESILDDYYFLWECYSEYKQVKQIESDCLLNFSQSFMQAVELKYIDFYSGEKFNGDEVKINVAPNEILIEQLLNYNNIPKIEIRVTVSEQGLLFLKQNNIV